MLILRGLLEKESDVYDGLGVLNARQVDVGPRRMVVAIS